LEISEQNIKYNKIWITKDKYIFRMGVGNHWYLKKFLVLYKYFLVDRRKIDNKVLLEIVENFQKFIDSVLDPLEKKYAEEYFFRPHDLRIPESKSDFESEEMYKRMYAEKDRTLYDYDEWTPNKLLTRDVNARLDEIKKDPSKSKNSRIERKNLRDFAVIISQIPVTELLES